MVDTTTRVVRFFWTGGWDSTFRLMQLIRCENILIEPFYVIDPDRRSTTCELKAMREIRGLVAARFPQMEGRLLPTRFFVVHELSFDADIKAWFKSLRQRASIGTQYEWLAAVARQENISDIELLAEGGAAPHFFDSVPFIKHHDPVIGEYYDMDPSVSRDSDLQLFRQFRFPIIKWTKLQMKDDAQRNGVLDIMLRTWFCHDPRKDSPCGLCKPCKILIKEQMDFRLPRIALLRYRFRYLDYMKKTIKKAMV